MSTKTLTRAEALELIDAAEQLGALAPLAAGWELSGHWNENAEWDAEDFREHVEGCALSDASRSRGPQPDDDTGLPDVELL